ncbi:flagellar hook-length control protein FliK [Rugamonas rubra]|uniref:Hook-length control protein FliK n=1 Tax=Rugamonas rubra TaxID=758825 RepID=A0A1I4JFF1_9BURK|nr:flagellar hook-length control protein FliK [Rugamonas rubra]SFL65289.1 hook-length control protein FliK [Rugamonas rubra]
MLPRIDALVTPAGPVSPVTPLVPAGEGRQEEFQRSLQTLVGQSLQGQVLSQYKDGSYLVRVAGNAARMQLPAGVQVGAEVSLTLLAAQPRPVFQFGGEHAQGGQTALVYAQPPPGRAPAGGEAGGPGVLLPSQENHTPPGATPRPPAGANPAGQPALPGGAAAGGAPAPPPGTTPGTSAGAALPGAATPPPLPSGATPAAAPAGATLPPPAGAAPNSAANPAAALATANASASATLLAAGLPAAAAPAAARPARSLAATLLGRAPLTPAADLPELDAGTEPATLSQTARVLTSVLGTANSVAGASAGLVGRAALVASGAPLPEQLAQTLRETIANSGLFYESHVAEWVKGQRTLPELMREPQMQRLAQGLAQGGAETAARAANAGPDLAAAQMVNQQLHSQEHARVQWQGDAWPGQPMQWHIQREQREQGQQSGGQDDGAAPEQVWRSGVRFRFPLLGQVEASVTVVGGQIQIQVQTASEESAGTLRAYAERLESAMAAAGSPLSSLTIRAGDQHDG